MYYTLAVQVAGEAVGRRLLGNWWTWSASINYLAWIKKKKVFYTLDLKSESGDKINP